MRTKRFLGTFLLVLGLALSVRTTASAQGFNVNKLVSDIPGVATHTDSHLVNPWGLARTGSGPWWVANAGTGVSTLYDGSGNMLRLVVTIPVPPGGTPPSSPTGTAFFQPKFLFATEEGVIAEWTSGMSAVLRIDNSGTGAVYKGLTVATHAGQPAIFAANFSGGAIELYDSNYQPIALAPGEFQDPMVPAGWGPFNVQAVAGRIVVCWAQKDATGMDEQAGPGLGLVSVFDASGMLLGRLQYGSYMNAPWGVALAPSNFGSAAGKVLVGMFGSGQIAVFDPMTLRFVGNLMTPGGTAITIPGLWALMFGNGGSAGPTNALYFTAGIANESHGLFGSITPQ